MAGLLGWLIKADPAEAEAEAAAGADARHLRDLHGARAEAWCKAMLAALPPGDARRGSIRAIVRALRHVPVPKASRAVAGPAMRLEPGSVRRR